ncbi:ribonuclease H-like domain-containing protein [Halocalculus aciditolerans]|nr:ribonuclease H-like domain-containing protein [Halocalculus aciditolerans]
MRVENSFIGVDGVGERTERKLWEQGVTHWDDFDADLLGSKTGAAVADYIDEGTTRLDAGDARFFADSLPDSEHWRLYENFRTSTAFFDIETTGLDAASSVVTTVSVTVDGETTTLVRGQDLTGENLRALFDDAALLVSFNGKRFDVPFLEHHFDVALADRPHVDLMYLAKRVGLSGGLKAIEPELGIHRDDDVDGREAVRLWRQYENHGDDAALDRLVAYNRDDTEHLETILDEVAGRVRAETFDPYL